MLRSKYNRYAYICDQWMSSHCLLNLTLVALSNFLTSLVLCAEFSGQGSQVNRLVVHEMFCRLKINNH